MIDTSTGITSGPGVRVCVLSAEPVDRLDIWIQAAGTGSREGHQCVLLPDL